MSFIKPNHLKQLNQNWKPHDATLGPYNTSSITIISLLKLSPLHQHITLLLSYHHHIAVMI